MSGNPPLEQQIAGLLALLDGSWSYGITAAGATGVHLGVDEGNTGAGEFYLRLGFTELAGPPGARWYGRSLGSRSR